MSPEHEPQRHHFTPPASHPSWFGESSDSQAVLLRAGLVHSMTHSAFLKLLEGVHGVQGAEVE